MLREAQSAFAEALIHGPDALAHHLFAGDQRRVLLAMAAHANTVSHARLLALEDSFPALRRAVGDAVFNQLARGYVDAGCATAEPLNSIGRAFPDWLEQEGQGAAMVAIARFDAAWLDAHHSSDARAMTLSDLPTDADALLSLSLARHPAASVHEATPALLAAIEQEDWPDADAILITRPALAVRAFPLSSAANSAWEAIYYPIQFNILCDILSTHHNNEVIIAAITALIRAGALMPGDTG